MTEAEKLEKVRRKEWRMIGKKRKRALRKRGIRAWWDSDLNSFIWIRPTPEVTGTRPNGPSVRVDRTVRTHTRDSYGHRSTF